MTRYLKKLRSCFLRYRQEEKAATAMEYGMIIAFMSIVILATVFAIGGHIEGFFEDVYSYISSE